MKIPKRFKLLGQTIEVVLRENLISETDYVGRAVYRENKIELQKNLKGMQRPLSQIDHTFWHEVTHHILCAMNENELRSNEKFVDVFAGLLHQVLTTMEGEIHK